MPTRAAPARLIAAYAAVYLIWGSTYLGVRFAIEALPPFLMSAIRFLIAGGVLYGWMRVRGHAKPRREDWRTGLIAGALIVAIGFGVFAWGQYFVASSVAAIIAAAFPVWLVLLDWLAFGAPAPRARIWIGIALGMLGIALLVSPGGAAAPPTARGGTWIGVASLTAASVCYALGSLISRHRPVRGSPLMGAAMQMLAGGALMMVIGLLLGEWSMLRDAVALGARAAPSWIALAYLTVFGGIVAYGAYIWLLEHDTPARASTYAYVNPIIAMLLGWWLGGERITVQMIGGAAVILGGVALITLVRDRRSHAAALSTDSRSR